MKSHFLIARLLGFWLLQLVSDISVASGCQNVIGRLLSRDSLRDVNRESQVILHIFLNVAKERWMPQMMLRYLGWYLKKSVCSWCLNIHISDALDVLFFFFLFFFLKIYFSLGPYWMAVSTCKEMKTGCFFFVWEFSSCVSTKKNVLRKLISPWTNFFKRKKKRYCIVSAD